MNVIEVDADTCDRCGPNVNAYLYAKLRTGTLAYCAHCGTRFLPELERQGARIIDMRHLIHEQGPA